MAAKDKLLKIADVIGLAWSKVPENPSDHCDFCSTPLYNDGWWQATSSSAIAGRWRTKEIVHKACKRCALGAGLEW